MTYSEWLKERACAGKLAWAKPRDAKREARNSARFYCEPRDVWEHYRCQFCRLWHIGHRTGWAA